MQIGIACALQTEEQSRYQRYERVLIVAELFHGVPKEHDATLEKEQLDEHQGLEAPFMNELAQRGAHVHDGLAILRHTAALQSNLQGGVEIVQDLDICQVSLSEEGASHDTELLSDRSKDRFFGQNYNSLLHRAPSHLGTFLQESIRSDLAIARDTKDGGV